MTIVDDRGRLFGRINLVDGAAGALVLLLIPFAYGTYLLFRPSMPRIDAVSPSLISREERRIAIGGQLTAKFKVTGTGFTPLLRARIGDVEALGFVFENPNSADILVGPVPPGAHDLVLLDGVQEVARAVGAISVQPLASSFVRAVGWLINLDEDEAKTLRVGLAFPEAESAFEILALGPVQPGRARIKLAGSLIDRPVDGLLEREAVLTIRCDPAIDNPCTMGERTEHLQPPVRLSLPGPSRVLQFDVHELLAPGAPRLATVHIRLPPEAPASAIRVGDRDRLLDERAAVVTAIGRTVELKLGLDNSREGWRYRSQLVKAGSAFVFETDRYQASGTVEAVTLSGAPAAGLR
jgi:hypothetical protein